MEVCDDSALAVGNWDEFVASAFDDCKRNWLLRH
jgi:hypothetical protein